MFVIMSYATLWLLLFKLNVSIMILDKILLLLLKLLAYCSELFGNFLNTIIYFHQISWISTALCMLSFVIMTNKRYRMISSVLFIPFIIETFNRPNNLFLISKTGEVAILQNGILHAKTENFTTRCWAQTLGAQLAIDDNVNKHATFRYMQTKRKANMDYVNEIESIKLDDSFFLSSK